MKSFNRAGKQLLKRIARACGYQITRYDKANSPDVQLNAMLELHSVNLVFDVGANTGQFGASLREHGYRGSIVSFEPLAQAWAELIRVTADDDTWQVAPRGALGRFASEIDLHVAGNSTSSSILPMLAAHNRAAPYASYVGVERTPVMPLDIAGTPYLTHDSIVFLKIDTQGYEHEVLAGAAEVVQRAIGVQIELSLMPLYKGQSLYDELLPVLRGLGFELWSVRPGFTDPASGRLLQMDAILFRRTDISKSATARRESF